MSKLFVLTLCIDSFHSPISNTNFFKCRPLPCVRLCVSLFCFYSIGKVSHCIKTHTERRHKLYFGFAYKTLKWLIYNHEWTRKKQWNNAHAMSATQATKSRISWRAIGCFGWESIHSSSNIKTHPDPLVNSQSIQTECRGTFFLCFVSVFASIDSSFQWLHNEDCTHHHNDYSHFN